MDDGEPVTALLARAGSRTMAVRASHVVETMRPLPTEALGGAPDYVRGVALVRGGQVPVVSLAALLGEPGAPRGGRWISLRVGARTVALEVDSVIGVRSIAAGDLRALPPLAREAGAGAIASLGLLDGELLSVLDAVRVVPEEVLVALSMG